MDSPIRTLIDDLVARRIVEDYDTFSIVKTPGSSILAALERAKLVKTLQQQQPSLLPDADALRSALRCITPPLDEEAEREESRLLEAQSRKELEDNGCPPCYPPYLEVPLRNVPEKFKAITSYWESFPGTGDVVLRAQLSDWQNFRSFQRRIRQYYRKRPFSEFVTKARNRRRKHNLDGNVRLRFDVNRQSRLENWTEFEDYHLQIHESLEKEGEDLKVSKGMRRSAKDIGSGGFDGAAKACQQRLKYTEWKLQQHKILLQWTEEERMAMDISYPVPAKEDSDDMDALPKVVRATCAGSRRKRQAKTLTVLGDVKISKAKPKKQEGQLRTRTISGLGSTVEDSAAAPQSSSPQEPECWQAQPRQCRLQRVS